MPDTAVRLAGPLHLPAAATTVYTVPGGVTAILRHVRVVNGDSAARAITMSLGADGASTRLFDALRIPAKGVAIWTGFEVLDPGEVLQAFGSVANVLVLTVSGVEVT